VSSKYDLACHDVSIIQHIFSEKCIQSNWIEFKKDYNASQNGTVVGYLKYEFFDSFIMGSWEHYEKTRDFIFNFEKKQVIWDDNNKKVKYVSKDGIEVFDFLKDSALDNSIQTFMSGNKSDLKHNRKITHDVTNIINN
jgi:anthranilate/para-aminobenzoate synthase component I